MEHVICSEGEKSPPGGPGMVHRASALPSVGGSLPLDVATQAQGVSHFPSIPPTPSLIFLLPFFHFFFLPSFVTLWLQDRGRGIEAQRASVLPVRPLDWLGSDFFFFLLQNPSSLWCWGRTLQAAFLLCHWLLVGRPAGDGRAGQRRRDCCLPLASQ